jgi:antitoxin component YwqK of YwqJK toxin-antitoxin module
MVNYNRKAKIKKVQSTENYVDGKLDGKRIYYNEDGSKEKEMTLKKGNLDGEVKIFSDNNQLAVVLYYKKDVLTGYSYEDKNGALVPVIALPKGQGAVVGYFKNGNKSISLHFNESIEEGDRTFYYTNGKERLVGKRINGEDAGVKKLFYPDGKLMKEENYVDGEMHGPARYYTAAGNPVYDVNYYNGYLHGDCKYYETGKPVSTLVYYYGALEAKK